MRLSFDEYTLKYENVLFSGFVSLFLFDTNYVPKSTHKFIHPFRNSPVSLEMYVLWVLSLCVCDCACVVFVLLSQSAVTECRVDTIQQQILLSFHFVLYNLIDENGQEIVLMSTNRNSPRKNDRSNDYDTKEIFEVK